MTPEIHLFIIWENALPLETKIINDINEKFEIIDICSVHWSDKHYSTNLSRFYGEKLPKDSQKEQHCGKGPFLAIVVKDNQPVYAERSASNHRKIIVNKNMFDSKTKYRDWTGGGHKIHATNDLNESDHDLALLFGRDLENYKQSSFIGSKTQRNLHKDLVGTEAWVDIEELFYVLNKTTNYVVLRNFECLPNEYNMESHGDIDLLASNYNEIKLITNSIEVFKSRRRVQNIIKIGKDDVLFDFRHIGDQYYDEGWEKDILSNKIMHKGCFYIPNQEHHFYSLLYHGAVHKPSISKDYKTRLLELAIDSDIHSLKKSSFNDISIIKSILEQYLHLNNYSFSEPCDLSVYFNEYIVGRQRISKLRRFIVDTKNLLRPFKNPIRLSKDIILWLIKLLYRVKAKLTQ